MEDAADRRPPYLPDDITVEILSRLPAKSLCRSKCVSKSWRSLISDPAHRHRLGRTSTPSFFFRRHLGSSIPAAWGFVTAEGDRGLPLVDSALSFLPASTCGEIELLDSCNGLLLLRCCSPATGGSTVSPPPKFYVVCNPATAEWVALPPPSLEPGFKNFYTKACTAALGFDPAVSSHFHVFQVEEQKRPYYGFFIEAVEIYSSETGTWERKKAEWRTSTYVGLRRLTYLNGFLHLTRYNVVAMVDTKGQSWRTIGVPLTWPDGYGFLSRSQGRLVYVDVVQAEHRRGTLVVYVLEDHNSDKWTRKHKVRITHLFGPEKLPFRLDKSVAAFDPNHDRIFFYDRPGKRLMSYDMNQGCVHVICTLEDVANEINPFSLYGPLYSGMLNG